MAKKKENKGKIKWGKILMWIFGVVIGLALVCIIGFKIWVSTWQTYRNDEFGFSFRYPKNWYVTADLPVTRAQVNKYSSVSFYIDLINNLPNYSSSGPIRSPGDVQVFINDNSGIMDAHKLQANYLKPKEVKYGAYVGYTSGGKGGLCDEAKSYWGNFLYKNGCPLKTLVLGKAFDLKTANYYFYVNTLSYTDNMSIISQTKTRFYNWIGSKIVDSFIFTK